MLQGTVSSSMKHLQVGCGHIGLRCFCPCLAATVFVESGNAGVCLDRKRLHFHQLFCMASQLSPR